MRACSSGDRNQSSRRTSWVTADALSSSARKSTFGSAEPGSGPCAALSSASTTGSDCFPVSSVDRGEAAGVDDDAVMDVGAASSDSPTCSSTSDLSDPLCSLGVATPVSCAAAAAPVEAAPTLRPFVWPCAPFFFGDFWCFLVIPRGNPVAPVSRVSRLGTPRRSCGRKACRPAWGTSQPLRKPAPPRAPTVNLVTPNPRVVQPLPLSDHKREIRPSCSRVWHACLAQDAPAQLAHVTLST